MINEKQYIVIGSDSAWNEYIKKNEKDIVNFLNKDSFRTLEGCHKRIFSKEKCYGIKGFTLVLLYGYDNFIKNEDLVYIIVNSKCIKTYWRDNYKIK